MLILPLLGESYHVLHAGLVVQSCSGILRRLFYIGGYHWLSENYECRDQIFLFSNGLFALIISGWTVLLILVLPGFSHGAYQVRVLARMIERVGP